MDTWYDGLDSKNDTELPEEVSKHPEQYVDERFKILSRIIYKEPKLFSLRLFVRVAALLLVLVGSLFLFKHYYYPSHKVPTFVNKQVGIPGSNGAILTLANGQQIVLDSTNGAVAVQGSARVTNDSGRLSYISENTKSSEVVYNTLSTPRGRQYTLLLPDGTKAILNAASSIIYPTTFSGKNRQVEVTGEVYFEVVHNTSLPFVVKSGNMTIRDIGTHFDIMNFSDETNMKTTLIEGAVTVEMRGNTKSLQPGQQAVIGDNEKIEVKVLPDAEEVIAWTKGIIDFNNVDVPTLLKQLGRWYNIDIVYKTKIPQGSISGGIPRNTELSIIVKALNENGVHCHMEGDKLIITQ